jgi:hypothetical protein
VSGAMEHRLEGLTADNLLAVLALVGLLRALESVRPGWRPRASWGVDAHPLRPVLHLREPATAVEVCEAAADGVARLAKAHDFGGHKDLNYSEADARRIMSEAQAELSEGGEDARLRADVLTALMSDGAIRESKGQVETTPFCLLFGQGHQHFLDRFAAVPNTPSPPPRGRGKKQVTLTAAECLHEALFEPWARQDESFAFRWDPAEDVRYATLAFDPSSEKTCTQHGANRLAAVGLPALPVAPVANVRSGHVRLLAPGVEIGKAMTFAWPIWTEPASLAAIQALLGHPDLRDPGALAHLGVVEVMQAQRMLVGKFMNWSWARPVE